MAEVEGEAMTEAEWLACENPPQMLRHLRARFMHRKCRLFAVACCRHLQPGFPDERSRTAVEVAERFAEGLATEEEVTHARTKASGAHTAAIRRLGRTPLLKEPPTLETAAVNALAPWGYNAAVGVVSYLAYRREGFSPVSREMQGHLLRDIFGNPFRPIAFDPAWRTSTAVALADGIYADRAFDRLPILADALQDAGCEDADLLGHLRGDGPHVRGCWALDLVLGKE